MRITELKKHESRHALLESLNRTNLDTYLVWENVGYQLREAALSPQQIQGLFAEIEKTATEAGSNRTAVGKGLDKVNQAIVKPWNDLKAKVYNSGPMQGFAQKYDAAAEQLKQSAGGDEGRVMQAVKKYRQFAEKHPIMQGFIYAALIAAAGVSGAGLGGAAALGLFKLTDQLLQGKDIRSALYSAGKTGALAAGASTLGDLVRGGEVADTSGDPFKVDQSTADDMKAAGIDSVYGYDEYGTDKAKLAQMSPIEREIYNDKMELKAKADLVAPGGTGEGIVVRGDIPITDPELIDQFNTQFPGTQAMSPEATQWLKDNVPGAAENLDAKAAAQADRLKNLTPAQLARRNSLLQSGHSTADALTEDQITKLFVAIAYKQDLMEAPGMLSKLKQQVGKGVSKLGQKARQVGTNITTKVTADKLMKAWTKAGKPTDSVQIAQWLTTQGIDGAVMQQAFQTAGIKMPDLKKIASDDPVMALAQKINTNPGIKKQILQYLDAVTT